MPVEDHPIHERTRFAEIPRPGCYNLPRPDTTAGYFILTRKYQPDGRYFLEDEFVPYRFTIDCQNDHRHPHPECSGCQHHRLEKK